MGVSTQVIIVGAGPVGLTAALRLAEWGVDCLLVEAASALPKDLRASTFHPPTLDMLGEYGLDKELLQEGLICPSWQIRQHETGDRVIFDLSLLEGETQHPYRLQCEQFRLCKLLMERLQSYPNVEIMMGTSAINVTQDDDQVCLTISRNGEEDKVTAELVIAADGAHSSVRELIGERLAGKTYPETTILAVTSFPFEEYLPGLSNVNYVWTEGGTYSLLRLRDFWRCSLYPGMDEPIEQAVRPESIERKLQAIVKSSNPYPVEAIRPYRVHMRIVDDYRVGRVALAGDAAHVNSPSGGMGMNGGIHDAFNLTVKVRQILNGGSLELLDQYTRQRRPVAEQEILGQADRNRRRMQERSPEKRAEILEELKRTVADPSAAKAYLMKSSMIEGLRRSETIA
jgi:2-polyprenyl-6-methoxyphenol hydroxylase-like FAD-dependent oxidoreductase